MTEYSRRRRSCPPTLRNWTLAGTLSTLFTAAALVGPCLAQVEGLDLSQPPKMIDLANDSFNENSLDDYQHVGSLKWHPGFVEIPPAASFSLKRVESPRVTTRFSVQFPKYDESGKPTQLDVDLKVGGGQSFKLTLTESKESELEIQLFTSIGFLIKPERRARIEMTKRVLHGRIEYSYGLIHVYVNDELVLTGYNPANRISSVRTISLHSKSASLQLEHFAVVAQEIPQTDLTLTQKASLRWAKAQRVIALGMFEQGRLIESEQLLLLILQRQRVLLNPFDSRIQTLLIDLATLRSSLGDYESALELFEFASPLAVEVYGIEHPEVAAISCNIGFLGMHTGDWQSAKLSFDESRRIAKATLGTLNRTYALSTFGLAAVAIHQGDLEEAAEHMSDAWSLAEAIPLQPKVRFSFLEGQAALAFRMGNIVTGQRLAEEALNKRRNLLPLHAIDLVQSLKHVAEFYSAIGDRPAAAALLREAIDRYEAQRGRRQPMHAQITLKLAKALASQASQREVAKSLLAQSINELQESPWLYRHELASCHLELSRIHRLTGEIEQAQLQARNAKRILEQDVDLDRDLLVQVMKETALLTSIEGDFPAAEKGYRNAEHLARTWDSIRSDTLGEIHLELGDLAIRRGDFDGAYEEFRQAEEIRKRKIDDSFGILPERQQKINIASSRHVLDRCVTAAVEAHVPPDEILSFVWQWKGSVDRQQQHLRRLAKVPEVATTLNRLLQVRRRLSATSVTPPPQPHADANKLEHERYSARKEHWTNQVESLNRESEAIERQLAYQGYELREIGQAPSISSVKAALPPRTAYVEFVEYGHLQLDDSTPLGLSTERRYVAFVVTSTKSQQVTVQSPADEIGRWIEEFQSQFQPESWSVESQSAANQAGRNLREHLWQPIESHLDEIDTILISPVDDLSRLSFVALPGKELNSFLIEDYRVATLPYVHSLLEYGEGNQTEDQPPSMLLVGDIEYGAPTTSISDRDVWIDQRGLVDQPIGNWEAHPGFTTEFKQVHEVYRSAFPGAETLDLLESERASEEQVIREVQRHQILHFITHGYFAKPSDLQSVRSWELYRSSTDDETVNQLPPHRSLLSGLVLAGANQRFDLRSEGDNGILTGSEIEALSLEQVDLVVMAACRTAVGPIELGDSQAGLVRSFQLAGARTVIGTHWSVEDISTSVLMQRFYTNLLIHRMGKLDALRSAQLEMLNDPELIKVPNANLQARDEPRKAKNIPAEFMSGEPSATTARTPAFFWAGFQLSGDWQ